jgi:hypothetical protein
MNKILIHSILYLTPKEVKAPKNVPSKNKVYGDINNTTTFVNSNY